MHGALPANPGTIRPAHWAIPADAGQARGLLRRAEFCQKLVYAVARAADRGKTTRFDAAGCILYASEAATRVALETIQALGGNGYTNDYPAGRLLRDAKLYEIGAGTNEIRRMLMGRELLRP